MVNYPARLAIPRDFFIQILCQHH